jgi:hypothetical protein
MASEKLSIYFVVAKLLLFQCTLVHWNNNNFARLVYGAFSLAIFYSDGILSGKVRDFHFTLPGSGQLKNNRMVTLVKKYC